jgi:hypothetical protein
MLPFLKRKPEPVAQVAQIEPPVGRAARRGRQQNIKVSADCAATFAAIAEAQGYTKAGLFEDMVEERRQQLEKLGVPLNIG